MSFTLTNFIFAFVGLGLIAECLNFMFKGRLQHIYQTKGLEAGNTMLVIRVIVLLAFCVLLWLIKTFTDF